MTDHTTTPKLKHFRQILFWPLQLKVPDARKAQVSEDGFASVIKSVLTKNSAWEAQDDLYRRGMNAEPTTRYAEFVYFHPFIRRFLYGEPNSADKERALHLCQRNDVKKLQMVLRYGEQFELDVDRIHLYLFDIEVTILVMEISSTQLAEAELRVIENLVDQLRRAYPPYWDGGGAGHSPQKVILLDKNNHPIATGDYNRQPDYLEIVETHKTSPVADHWRFLLEPLKPYTRRPDNDICYQQIEYEQIEDERIPLMAFFAFDKPALLTKGDFMRLAFADDGGDSHTFPYSTSFAETFEAEYAYDRFWEAPNDLNKIPGHNWMNTRYFCCGYAFTMIGEHNESFFTDIKGGALAHFRHHYFQMGLIAHFHKAALLMLWDELAQAVAKFSKDKHSRQAFREDVSDILERLLHFTHRYWFTEISNQIQAKELFNLWSQHLGSRELFERIMKEAQDAHQYLEMDAQQRQTDTTIRLTVIATIGLGMALVLGVFGGGLHKLWGDGTPSLWDVLLVFSFIFALIGILLSFSKKVSRFFEYLTEKKY